MTQPTPPPPGPAYPEDLWLHPGGRSGVAQGQLPFIESLFGPDSPFKQHPAGPPGPQPPPAASPAPGVVGPNAAPAPSDDGFAGRAADASQRVDDALAKNTTAVAEADEELVDAVLGAQTGSQEGKAQLEALQNALIDQIHKLGPSLDTPAGQQQLNDFLQGKAQEILGIVKSSAMDAESKAEVLDALSQRYGAVKDSGTGSGTAVDTSAGGGTGQTGGGTTASADVSSSGAGGEPALASDPVLDGLASDPLMGGLGALGGPAMGALSGLPAAMGSMMPGAGGFGGGGLPLGDLGGVIGGAIRDAATRPPQDSAAPLVEDDRATKAGEQIEPPQGTDAHADDHDDDQPGEGEKSDPGADSSAKPGDGAQPQAVAAESGQVPAAHPGPDVLVKLPDGSTVAADSPQVAHAGRLHLQGASFDDSASQAQIGLLPPGAPVTDPVSPGQLRFGDYAQFTDHRVMALDGRTVFSGGQVIAVEEMPTGPTFLGWARPEVQPAQATPAPAVLPGTQ